MKRSSRTSGLDCSDSTISCDTLAGDDLEKPGKPVPVVSKRVQIGGHTRGNGAGARSGGLTPSTRVAAVCRTVWTSSRPSCCSSMAVFGRAVCAYVKTVWLSGLPAAAAYHTGKFRNDVSLTPTLTGELWWGVCHFLQG